MEDAGNATVQHAVLSALASAGRCMLINEIAASAGLGRRQATAGAARLIDRGFAVRRERGCIQATEQGVAHHASGGELRSGPTGPIDRKKPVASALPTRLWRAMRMKQKFTAADLLNLAARDDERAAVSTAHSYLRALREAGYLAELPPGARRAKRYVLLRDSGPKTPIARFKAAEVYDPNTGTTHPRLRDEVRP